MSRNNPTLRDVAKLAGVAVGTISNYLNNPDSVKPKNRERIENAIRVLHFTPNTMAQRLASGRTNTILLYILSEQEIGDSTWLHQLPLIQAVNDRLHRTKYNLQIKIGQVTEAEHTLAYIQNCIQGRIIDGIAILSAWEVPRDILKLFLQADFPYVLLENKSDYTNHACILFDNEEMVVSMVDYLAELGHRKIAFVDVKSDQQHIRSRFRGYIKGITKYQMQMNKEYVRNGDFTIESGRQCAREMLELKEPPTSVICGNDNMAVGMIEEIQAKGFRVPEDISVMGIDNSIVSKAVVPNLTTMEMPLKQMGELAIKELLLKINNPEHQIENSVFAFTRVERRSTGTACDSVFYRGKDGQ